MKSTMLKKQQKREIRNERRKEKQRIHLDLNSFSNDDYFQPIHNFKSEVKPLKALNEKQFLYLNLIKNNDIIFATGCAGTGKTYVAGSYAADQLKEGNIERIIITRPAKECGEDFGFLPGELEEKYAPYIEPFIDVLNKRLGKSQVKYFMSHGKIVAKPLAFMRGSSFSDCLVIFDEAQNSTVEQMKMFLTRIGENCKFIIDGDIEQCDLKETSGLQDAIFRLKSVPNIGHVHFEESDIVRSGMCREIIKAYNKK